MLYSRTQELKNSRTQEGQAPLETIGQPVKRKRSLTGQAIIEYALFAGVVVAALLAMQGYMKRGIQAVVMVAADDAGNQGKGGLAFDARYSGLNQQWLSDSKSTSSTAGTSASELKAQGEVTYTNDETTTGQGGILSTVLSWERQ